VDTTSISEQPRSAAYLYAKYPEILLVKCDEFIREGCKNKDIFFPRRARRYGTLRSLWELELEGFPRCVTENSFEFEINKTCRELVIPPEWDSGGSHVPYMHIAQKGSKNTPICCELAVRTEAV
jgi:hypothetical protein